MEEQFIPYELALKLKELGFDEECFGWWSWINGNTASFYSYPMSNKKMDEYNMSPKNCSAPLWQQAFDWFELKHKLYSVIENVLLSFGIVDCRNNNTLIIKPIDHDDTYKSREEVRLECLKKLIELCKNVK